MPTPPNQLPAPLQPGPFRERLIVYLLPYFMPLTENFDLARAEVLETLASYGARTRSEAINAARIIAFSFSALELLAEAKGGEMSHELRMRYRMCANALDRSSQQIEARLTKSLACDLPAPAEAEADPVNDMPDAEVEAALQHARAQIETYRNRLSGAHPATLPQAIFAAQQTPATPPLGSRAHPK
jgi:hypothetical protein